MTRQASVSVSWVSARKALAVSAISRPPSRFSSKVMPSGSFLSSSLSCAPVAADTLMDTSATLVAGPMPQPSILPIRFSGDVAGFDSAVRGLVVPPSPPKMPPGVDSGVGAGEPPGVGSGTPCVEHHHQFA